MSLKSMFLQIATNGKVIDVCEISSVTLYIIVIDNTIATCTLSEHTPTNIQNAVLSVERDVSKVQEIKLKNL